MNAPLRILVVHPSDELYGADVALLELARRLDRQRFQMLVVVPNDMPYEGLLGQELGRLDICYRRMNLGILRRRYFSPVGVLVYLWRLCLSILQLAALIRRERIDIVHSNTTAVLGGGFASRLTRRTHIWQVHEIVTQPRFLPVVTARLLYWLSDVVVAVSTPVRDHLVHHYRRNETKTVVIHNGLAIEPYEAAVDEAAVRAEFGFSPADIVMGMVGRIHPGKGHEVFLQAAARVSQAVPSSRFLVVGSPFYGREALLAALQAQAAQLGLGDRVVFAGYRRDMPRVMGGLDLLVLPTTHPESFGLVAVEAMAAGRPVVATAHGGPLEIVVDGATGRLVPPGDVAALAEALMELAQSPELRHRLGQAGHARAVTCFSATSTAQAFERLYQSMVE